MSGKNLDNLLRGMLYFNYSKTRNYLYIFIISSIDASALYCRLRLILAKSFSMGFNSGEYGGKNSKLAPHVRINAPVCRPLWKLALSKITTCFYSGDSALYLQHRCLWEHKHTDENLLRRNPSHQYKRHAYLRRPFLAET